MIVDIDIKIADSRGNILQHLIKRFDDIDTSENRLNFSLDIGKSFEQFLSEYMTCSGRRVQEKLFSGKYSLSDSPYRSGESISSSGSTQSAGSLSSAIELPIQLQEDNLQENYMDRALEGKEIEYLFRIGNGNIFSGKFPVKQLFQVEDTFLESQGISLPNNPSPGYEDLNYLMQKAIEKYESTFCHITQDQKERVEEPQLDD
jgi:hypothetical protein